MLNESNKLLPINQLHFDLLQRKVLDKAVLCSHNPSSFIAIIILSLATLVENVICVGISVGGPNWDKKGEKNMNKIFLYVAF